MKISKLSRLIRPLLLLCAATEVAFFILAWSNTPLNLGPWSMHVAAKGLLIEQMSSMSAMERGIGVLLGLPALLCMLYGLWNLDRLLAGIQQQNLFSLQNIARLRTFAGAVALSTLLSIAEVPARTAVMRLLPGQGDGNFSVSVSSEELILLLVCIAFYLITGMMHEGRRLAEENEGFV
ncbi:DUF2975 domain-containing protein [Undibacterium sp. Ji49W]|uniref:DUF2975 domain-containing protein n=1 Tax=Undibacterium sp. Ji49W TaxID=3413040 RepID=UPI003BF1A3D7